MRINATQALVLGFLGFAWLALVVILVLAPEIYAASLNLGLGDVRLAEVGFLAALTVFILFIAVGVVRRWRWIFWLLLLASLAGVLRTLTSALQLAGVAPQTAPAWYTVLQGAIGLVQLALGLRMFAGYRRSGVWGA